MSFRSILDPKRPLSPPTTATGVLVRRVRSDDFEFIAELGARAFGEFGYAGGLSSAWMAEHFSTWVAVRAPIDGVPIDGVPIDRVPIDGVPIDGVPTDRPAAQPRAPSSGSGRPPKRLGFVVLSEPRKAHFEITAIAVVSGERGKGVGALLMATAEGFARQRGARTIVAHTADANTGALQLLLRRGYRIARRLPGYYGVYAACELVLQCR